MDLSTEVVTRGPNTVLALAGDIDIHTAPQLTRCLTDLTAQGVTTIVVDLSEVQFLDSSALGALVTAQHTLTANGGTLKIASPRPHVVKIFSITRLAEVIPVFTTVEEACE